MWILQNPHHFKYVAQQNRRNIEYVFSKTLIMITVYVLVCHF